MSKQSSNFEKSFKTLKVYYSVVLKNFSYQLGYLCGIAGYTIFGGVLAGLLLKNLVDSLVGNKDPQQLPQIFTVFMISYAVLMLLNMMFRFLADITIIKGLPEKYINELDRRCFAKLHKKDYDFFTNNHAGALVSKAQRFVDSYLPLDFSLTRGLFEIFILYVSSLIVLAFENIYLPLIFIVFSLVFFAIYFAMLPNKIAADLTTSESKSLIIGRLADTIINFLNLKVFSSFDAEMKVYNKLLATHAAWLKVSWFYSVKMYMVQAALILIFELAAFYFAFNLYTSGQISLGTIILLFTYLTLLNGHLIRLGNEFKNITRSLSSASEMTDILLSSDQEDFSPSKDYHSNIVTAVSIDIKNISFTYDNGKQVFNNFNLEIPAGQSMGLVGASGAGKTTLFKLLLGFTKIQSGEIFFNNRNLADFTRPDFASYISFVPQEPQLFHRSILENVAYGTNVEDLEVIEAACRRAYIYEMIQGLPKKFDTLVGERGIKLSTGEKQRLTLARAFLLNKPILMLDEPTSALDSESEHYVQLALQDLFRGKTVIVIAHRLSTIQMLDRIIVMSDGKIIQDGSHSSLLEEQSGTYQKLWNLQAKHF